MDWSKGGGFPALQKCDFWPLLKTAREQTYTLKNIRGAWSGAGLIPYNKLKILSHLGGPSLSTSQKSPQKCLQTPRNPRQFCSFMAQAEELMKNESVRDLIVKTVRMLEKLTLQEQAIGAVVQHKPN